MEDLKLKMDSVMLSHIEQYQTKEQTISSYCRVHNIKEHVFHYWYGKYKSLQKKSSLLVEGFVEIPLTATSSTLEVRVSNGFICHFGMLPPVDYLRKLIGV